METTETSNGLVRTERRGDIAIASMAAKAKAEVEARYVIAMQPGRQRNVMDVRNNILESCKRRAFAEGAIYRKPMGGNKTVDGFSIRFAEEAVKAMKNIAVDTMAIYEDDERLTIRISVTDLEANLTYADEARITKTVERRQLKDGQEAISKRTNSTGQVTYLVAATDDDLLNKINAAKSKAIRNSGLRLIPQDILEEAWTQIEDTLRKGGQDPKAELKKICDGFAVLRINPTELERYLGHSLETISPKELSDLRGIYIAIKEEETTWASVMEAAAPKKPAETGPKADPAATAATIDVAATKRPVIENPYEHLKGLIAASDVNESQVLAAAKKKKLTADATPELVAVSDTSLRDIIFTWTEFVKSARAVK